jgi:hypothetical protein
MVPLASNRLQFNSHFRFKGLAIGTNAKMLTGREQNRERSARWGQSKKVVQTHHPECFFLSGLAMLLPNFLCNQVA